LVAALKWLLCGFTWQDLPAYLTLAVSALPTVRTGRLLRGIGRLGQVGIAIVSAGVWILPAVPTLPPPDGRYAVATQVYRWTDAARDEPRTANPNDRRSVIAQAWYPTARRERSTGAARLPYIDGANHMPEHVSVMPGFLLRRYDKIDSHAEAMAPLARGDRPWPVVIFSPGYGAPRAVYTGLATQLASRGFVVFTLDHPYESGVTQLPDGRVVGESFLPGTNRTHYMVDQQAVRVADIRFVIDQLSRPEVLLPPLRNSGIDGSKVAVIGHSFGGASAIAALSEDSRVVAAANIDGTPYGDVPDRVLTRPFLLLQSDYAETHHSDLFRNGNGKLLARMTTAQGFHYEIKRANHYSFTDAPFFLAQPGRWLLSKVMGGERGPAATQQATADILTTFLNGPLTGEELDLAATVANFRGVVGGQVPRNVPALAQPRHGVRFRSRPHGPPLDRPRVTG